MIRHLKLPSFLLILNAAGTACLFTGCKIEADLPKRSVSEISPGWAQNSVNCPIFRKNAVISDDAFQFVAFYNAEGKVVIAKRAINGDNSSAAWEQKTTAFEGNVKDAHNSISIMLDGDGYLHLSWDHHNNPLHYTRSITPYGLEFPETSPIMTGELEQAVSYPEFYQFSNGDLLFAYRDGGSGNGNLVLNRYDLAGKFWHRLQENLIDGEGARNAYWQLCIDSNDTIHISWVWRETPNVSSNHDLSYARSEDGGNTWKRSDGTTYDLPIHLSNAEVVHKIPQQSNLINQTSMTTDAKNQPYIATYYRENPGEVTQFHVIYLQDTTWRHSTATRRSLDFELEGIGSRSIPVSRPQLLVQSSANSGKTQLSLLYRDEQFANQICLTQASLPELQWTTTILHPEDMGRWEPNYDSYRWQKYHQLHLFLQTVGQGQAETLASVEPQMVSVLECPLKMR